MAVKHRTLPSLRASKASASRSASMSEIKPSARPRNTSLVALSSMGMEYAVATG